MLDYKEIVELTKAAKHRKQVVGKDYNTVVGKRGWRDMNPDDIPDFCRGKVETSIRNWASCGDNRLGGTYMLNPDYIAELRKQGFHVEVDSDNFAEISWSNK